MKKLSALIVLILIVVGTLSAQNFLVFGASYGCVTHGTNHEMRGQYDEINIKVYARANTTGEILWQEFNELTNRSGLWGVSVSQLNFVPDNYKPLRIEVKSFRAPHFGIIKINPYVGNHEIDFYSCLCNLSGSEGRD